MAIKVSGEVDFELSLPLEIWVEEKEGERTFKHQSKGTRNRA